MENLYMSSANSQDSPYADAHSRGKDWECDERWAKYEQGTVPVLYQQ